MLDIKHYLKAACNIVFAGTDPASTLKRDVAKCLIDTGRPQFPAHLSSVASYRKHRSASDPLRVEQVFLADTEYFGFKKIPGHVLLFLNVAAVLKAAASMTAQRNMEISQNSSLAQVAGHESGVLHFEHLQQACRMVFPLGSASAALIRDVALFLANPSYPAMLDFENLDHRALPIIDAYMAARTRFEPATPYEVLESQTVFFHHAASCVTLDFEAVWKAGGKLLPPAIQTGCMHPIATTSATLGMSHQLAASVSVDSCDESIPDSDSIQLLQQTMQPPPSSLPPPPPPPPPLSKSSFHAHTSSAQAVLAVLQNSSAGQLVYSKQHIHAACDILFAGTTAANTMKREVAKYLIDNGPSELSSSQVHVPSICRYRKLRMQSEPKKVRDVFLAEKQYFNVKSILNGSEVLLSLKSAAIMRAAIASVLQTSTSAEGLPEAFNALDTIQQSRAVPQQTSKPEQTWSSTDSVSGLGSAPQLEQACHAALPGSSASATYASQPQMPDVKHQLHAPSLSEQHGSAAVQVASPPVRLQSTEGSASQTIHADQHTVTAACANGSSQELRPRVSPSATIQSAEPHSCQQPLQTVERKESISQLVAASNLVFSGRDAVSMLKREVSRGLIMCGPSTTTEFWWVLDKFKKRQEKQGIAPANAKDVLMQDTVFFCVEDTGKGGEYRVSVNTKAIMNAVASLMQPSPSYPARLSSSCGLGSVNHAMNPHQDTPPPPAQAPCPLQLKQTALPQPPVTGSTAFPSHPSTLPPPPPFAVTSPAQSAPSPQTHSMRLSHVMGSGAATSAEVTAKHAARAQRMDKDVYLLTPAVEGTSASETGINEGGDGLRSMFAALPDSIFEAIHRVASDIPNLLDLTDIILDEGCQPILRFKDAAYTVDCQADIQAAVNVLVQVKQSSGKATAGLDLSSDVLSPPVLDKLFGPDNRMGLPGTLHRISAMRTRDGSISGLTYRVGRHLPGVALPFHSLLSEVAKAFIPSADGDVMSKCTSILMVGRPGGGKTTLLRDMTHMLADMGLSVVVVDGSMEIGGCDRVKHPALGKARRMEVRHHQHQTLIEAVQNHAPHVIVVDEIGTKQEVDAVRSISQRGIAVIGTAHGIDLKSLMSNPVLVPLLGGIKDVILSDMQARRMNGNEALCRLSLKMGMSFNIDATKSFITEFGFKKTRLERAGAPAFTCLVEVLGRDQWRVHTNLAASVDRLLAQGAGGMHDDRD